VQDFRKLAVWRKAHHLTLKLYALTAAFPRDEIYGLTSQLRRAAASVPANIAEGCGPWQQSDLARFLQIAAGSATELEYHVLLARDLGYLTEADFGATAADVSEIKRMLTGLMRRLRVPALKTDN